MSEFPGPDELVEGGKVKKWSFVYDLTFLLTIVLVILLGWLAYAGYLIFDSWRYFF